MQIQGNLDRGGSTSTLVLKKAVAFCMKENLVNCFSTIFFEKEFKNKFFRIVHLLSVSALVVQIIDSCENGISLARINVASKM